MKIQTILILALSFSLSSCSSFVDKLHASIDGGSPEAKRSKIRKARMKRKDPFDLYRNKNKRKVRSLSSVRPGSNSQMYPKVKRNYQQLKSKKRYTVDDLYDNKNEGSLWVSTGQQNFLFAKNNMKSHGDIVIIQVKKTLRDAITDELKLSYRPQRKKRRRKPKGKAPAAKVAEAPSATEEDPDRIYDQIPSIVTEEISKDHLLLKGKKEVLYKGRKRLIEIQALVARRDITDHDQVQSDELIESNLRTLR